jgi:hypothetical protein
MFEPEGAEEFFTASAEEADARVGDREHAVVELDAPGINGLAGRIEDVAGGFQAVLIVAPPNEIGTELGVRRDVGSVPPPCPFSELVCTGKSDSA